MLNWVEGPVPLSAPVLFWACAANLPINSPTPKNISGSLPDSSDVVVYISELGKVEVGGQILNVLLLQLFFGIMPAKGLYQAFPHHYQGRIDFNTVNLCHSTGMDLVSIPASRVVLANPIPRDRIFQSYP